MEPFSRDRSSTLPKGNNVYSYPSVSVGWTFSLFAEATKNWLSYAKIRANYAEVGNDAPIFSVNDVSIRSRSLWREPSVVCYRHQE